MSTIPLASLFLLATFFPPRALLAPPAPLPSESGAVSLRPATGATLAAVMADMSRGREMEIRLTDAPPVDVEFVRYDVDRDILVYRKREPRTLRNTVVEVKPEQIDRIRLLDSAPNEGAVAGGMLVGMLLGATIGASLGSSDGISSLVSVPLGGLTGMCLGSVVGYITGSAVASSRHPGQVIWGRPSE